MHQEQPSVRVGRAQQVGQQVRQAQAVALSGPADRGQNLVGVCPGFGPVASGDLALQDGRADLAFGEVVRRLQARHVEEPEQLVVVVAQVLGETPIGGLADVATERQHQAPA